MKMTDQLANARAFSRPTSKAREKRPGDEVASALFLCYNQCYSFCFNLAYFLVDSNSLPSSLEENKHKMMHVFGSSSTHGVCLLRLHYPLKDPFH